MDESIMLKWVETVLKPYILTAPEGIEPLLFLDSYRCHMMASVVNIIQDMGVQVEHIPGGCTGLCQPIDVGIGKPLKNRVRKEWEDWMVEQGETVRFRPPSRQIVASWVVRTLQELPLEIKKKSWRHQPYSYFQNKIQDNENNHQQDNNEKQDNENDHQQDNNVL
jgi:DDE superfamily endonuclease